ncbi:MAG: mechanosensitive ion channel [Bacteroidales bacterium]|jgi:small-conductance mechanosensitive channel|nr:mechanosensitive ion channel [Bacteroidales bacterium]NLM92622.1 mechanosensitive ion channel [Bacteroidales bacterium]
MNLLYIVILGFALFFALQLINRLALLIPGEGSWRSFLLRSLPLLEFVVWLAFAFWSARIVFSGLPYRGVVESAMALVLIVALGWYVLRDFLNGVLLKSESDFKKGQIIKTPLVSGKVARVGYRTVQVETEKGEKVRIPFARLGDAIISSPPEKGQGHSQMLRFSLSQGKDTPGLPEEIKQVLYNLPWIILENEPLVHLVRDARDKPQLEVKFSVIKEEHALLVEQKLKAYLEGGDNRENYLV